MHRTDWDGAPQESRRERWEGARRELRVLLRALGPSAHIVRLGELAGQVVEVDRIGPADDETEGDGPPSGVYPRTVRRHRLVHPEGATADLVSPGDLGPPPRLRQALLAALGELHALTPSVPARLLFHGQSVLCQCAHAQAWLDWPEWERLCEVASEGPGVVVHRGATAEVTPLRGEVNALLIAVTRVRVPPADPLSALSPSQRAVVEYAAAGATSLEIARARACSQETVRSQLKEAYRRLGVASRAELGGLVARTSRVE